MFVLTCLNISYNLAEKRIQLSIIALGYLDLDQEYFILVSNKHKPILFLFEIKPFYN